MNIGNIHRHIFASSQSRLHQPHTCRNDFFLIAEGYDLHEESQFWNECVRFASEFTTFYPFNLAYKYFRFHGIYTPSIGVNPESKYTVFDTMYNSSNKSYRLSENKLKAFLKQSEIICNRKKTALIEYPIYIENTVSLGSTFIIVLVNDASSHLNVGFGVLENGLTYTMLNPYGEWNQIVKQLFCASIGLVEESVDSSLFNDSDDTESWMIENLLSVKGDISLVVKSDYEKWLLLLTKDNQEESFEIEKVKSETERLDAKSIGYSIESIGFYDSGFSEGVKLVSSSKSCLMRFSVSRHRDVLAHIKLPICMACQNYILDVFQQLDILNSDLI